MIDQNVKDILGEPGGFEKLTPGDTATPISAGKKVIAATGSGAIAAAITLEDFSINFTIDGTAPTALAGTNIGHKLDPGQMLILRTAAEVSLFQCIDRISGQASTVKITIYY